MDSILDWFSYLTDFRINFGDAHPLQLVNHILQALCFSVATCHTVAMLLKLVNFAYA